MWQLAVRRLSLLYVGKAIDRQMWSVGAHSSIELCCDLATWGHEWQCPRIDAAVYGSYIDYS